MMRGGGGGGVRSRWARGGLRGLGGGGLRPRNGGDGDLPTTRGGG